MSEVGVRALPHPDSVTLADVFCTKEAIGHPGVQFQFRNKHGQMVSWQMVFEHGESAEDVIYQFEHLTAWLNRQKKEP